MNNRKKKEKYQITHCLFCNKDIYDLKVKKRKYCCVSHQSKHKFILNPKLRKIASKNGTIAMNTINNNGKAFRMPKGYHTEEYKNKMKKIMTGRNVTWNDKIKKNHWSKNPVVRKRVIEEHSERMSKLISEGKLNNKNRNFKTGYYFSIKNNLNEYYGSSYELGRMQELDDDNNILDWTKKHGIKIPYEYENIIHNYIPDFLINFKNGNKILEEVKGWVNNEEIFKLKNKAAVKFCKKNSIIYRINFYKERKIIGS